VSADPRTLALSLGSLQFLQRLGVWQGVVLDKVAEPILQVHVSQMPPSLPALLGEAEVRFRRKSWVCRNWARCLATVRLLAPLQRPGKRPWPRSRSACTAALARPWRDIQPVPGGVELDTGTVEPFDLAVVAEGGVFAEQTRKPVVADYGQTAWVGTVTLAGAQSGMAFERFTRHGPAALLPLPQGAGGEQRAALVWCVPTLDDPVQGLDDTQAPGRAAHHLPAACRAAGGFEPAEGVLRWA
jgi:2-octaprenyl-6-methoxyphenol hydroxylase